MNPSALILIGASTGGPGRIDAILSALPPRFHGTIIIAQHMAEPFIPTYAKQLRAISPLAVETIQAPVRLEASKVYVCARTTQLFEREGSVWIEPAKEGEYPYNPEVDLLFASAALLSVPRKKLGVVLTGIGDDGAKGCLALHMGGGYCLFESEESATVYGMPRSAKELVPEGRVGGIEEIIRIIVDFGTHDV